ncbi:MAG: tetratricopeptide repeat protein [Bdellovibrionota bacterium]
MKQNFGLIALFSIVISSLLITSNSLALKNSNDPLSKEELMKELMGSAKGKDDITLYSEIVAFYQSNDQRRLRHRLQSLMTQYPRSNFIDNALYLAGRQSMENRNYPEAIKYFQKVITQYPQSNRVVSAKFAKAMTYKKMNLSTQSKGVLKEIKQKFPGSPESYRAESEMKLAR